MNAVPTSSEESACGPAVTLLCVASVEEEAIALADIDALAMHAGQVVVPVLEQADLPRRLARLLSRAGCEVCFATRDALLAVAPARQFAAPARPAAVYASKGVAREIAALAGTLCGIAACEVSDLSALPPDAPAPRSALVLINPETAHVQDVAAALAVAAKRSMTIGILYTIDPIESRLAVLKSLCIGSLKVRGRYAVLVSHSEGGSSATPSNLQVASGPEGRRRFESPQDVLLIGGHANPLDAMLGPGAGLCARASSETEPTYKGVFPCFEDGRCFRQPFMGRQAEDREGLVGIHASQASIIILSGCNVAALGRSWFSARHGLAYQTQQAAALAAAVTGSVTLARLELDLLFVALIAQGLPLGESVAEINRVRTLVLGHATCYANGVGPFFLLGNPCLRVEGLGIQDAEPRWQAEQSLSIDLDAIHFTDERGALVRVRMHQMEDAPFLFLRSPPDEMWCRGVWHPTCDGAWLYLWLGAERTESGIHRGHLHIDVCAKDPSEIVARAISHFLRQLPFWTVSLDHYRALQGDVAGLDAAVTALPGFVRELSRTIAALTPPAGVLVEARQARAIVHAAWTRMCGITEFLLRRLIDVVCHFGTLPLAGWEESFKRVDKLGPLAPCICGNPVWGQRYQFADNSSLMRGNYQCATCGPVGEDDCRRLLSLVDFCSTVTRGTALTATAECRAPADEVVYAGVVICIESLFRDRRMVGELGFVVVNPAESRRITATLAVPEELTPGTYPVVVLGVVNGAAYVIRRLLQITRVADLTPRNSTSD